jgi:hypothetical protein
MDADRFDTISRHLATAGSKRDVLRTLAGRALPRASARPVVLLVVLGVIVASLTTGSFPVGDDAAAGKNSLPPYTVKSAAGPSTVNQSHSVSASCDDGDQATGGGFEGVDFNTTVISDSTPFDSINNPGAADTWTVDYIPVTNADSLQAIVVCRDRKPKHS